MRRRSTTESTVERQFPAAPPQSPWKQLAVDVNVGHAAGHMPLCGGAGAGSQLMSCQRASAAVFDYCSALTLFSTGSIAC